MFLQERDAKAMLGQRNGCSESGKSAANNHYVCRRHGSGFHNPAPARTMIHAFSAAESFGCGFDNTS